MSFCTQCGNPVEVTAKFCGKCGAGIEGKKQALQKNGPLDSGVNPINSQPSAIPSSKKNQRNWKIGGLIAVALVAVIYFMVSPKQLSVPEYENLAIKLLVADELAMEEFGEAIEYSNVYFGFEPDWSEEYRQFVEPANKLEQKFGNLRKTLEDVKPPRQFEFEHETVLKAFVAHETMAASLGAFMNTGREEHIESFEEYESRAEEYIEESIFASEQYEDRVYEAYQSSMME